MHTHVHMYTEEKNREEEKSGFKRDDSGDTWLCAAHRHLDFGLSMTVGIVIGCLQALAVLLISPYRTMA